VVGVDGSRLVVEELKPEEIGKLLEKAGPTEWKYLLILDKWNRQGNVYRDYSNFEIVYGEVDMVLLEKWNSGYPRTVGEKYLIVPKTVPVVIVHYEGRDFGNGLEQEREVYIFTKDGWKRLEAY
jgi:hypothetical protein